MAAETPLVSVIVPVYNGKEYLSSCVSSLQAQTENDIEIILVDDGSTDGSGVMCDAFAAGDKRIVAVHQKNGGVSAARNKGLEIARGKYIMFCDCDDEVLPRYCQAHAEAMARPGVALTISSTQGLPSGIAALPCKEGVYFPSYDQLLQLWGAGWLWCCWGKCYDGGVVRRHGLRFHGEIAHGEDSIFVVEYITCLLDRSGQICLWQEHLYRYFDTPGSLSKITSAMADSMRCKLEAIHRMDELVGFDRREMEDLLTADRIKLTDMAFQDSLRRYRAWQVWRGSRAVKAALTKPDMAEVRAEGQRLEVFGHLYRRMLRLGSPLLLYLFLRLRWIILEGPMVRLLHRRRLRKF